MIRKLKRKFILTNMLLVSIVLAVVFAVLVGSNYQQSVNQSVSAMRMALKWSDEAPPPRFEFNFNSAPPLEGENGSRNGGRIFSMVPVFSVTVDANGTISAIQSGNNVTVSDEALNEAVDQALASGLEEGSLSRLNLRFLIERTGGSTRIAFADRTQEWESLQRILLTSLPVGAGALLVFFLVSLFLSKLSVRPVETAWEQQRQFVADASHELKTPLTVILANSGILLSHKSDTLEHQAKWVEYIQEEAKRMKGLVEDMLFLAKSDAARSGAVRASVPISELVTGCVLLFESVAFESGVALESDVTPGLTFSGDEGQLRRLTMILLDNACKYAGDRGRVDVHLTRSQEKLKLTVRNTGTPIPPEHLEHLFERFYRADSARSRDAGGFGLGLAIAKSIVDGHKGKISVTSTETEGTVFTVLFPVGK
ncbi:ATPase/histidine kinase/DNA gyrase B/HSP90 domain protein [uncultured Eubacteriales bacterium]|uniref:histidine kinase n=1 Tax=uncultured Eubacteriales bacterium TaxID=172733 RepID=A0A212J7V2_9FIRM|nr:ATPase/histidine kinase/DNA gyrase B/HSP90 domain protein [uncultured Eubacteriales bacterium]